MCLNPKIFPTTYGKYVSCGKCLECRMMKSQEWAFRIMDEASLYEENDFLTLTYNASSLPDSGSLRPTDLQKFLKRLRKAISPRKVRFFACGEYGARFSRPHYHIILFGFRFSDRFYFMTDRKGSRLFRSPLLERLWTFGYSTCAELTSDSALYAAKYMQKSPGRSSGLVRPFLRMSNRPGIGARYIADHPALFISDKDYHDGKSIPLPRYYIRSNSVDGVAEAVECQERRFDRFLTSSAPDFEALRLRKEKYFRKLGISLDSQKNL